MKALLLSASLFVATVVGLDAKTVRHPEKDPTFTITLPDDWSAAPDQEGNLVCKAGDGSTFGFSIQKMPAKTEEEMKAYFLSIVQEIFGDPEPLKVSEIKERTTPNGVTLFAITRTGPLIGVEMSYSTTAFSPKKGIWLGAPIVDTPEVTKAHEKAMNDIWNSIKFVSDEDAE